MMNILEVIFKLFSAQNSSFGSPADFANQILLQLKKILKSLIILLIGSVIFCLIMGYLIDRILTQMDNGEFYFTSSIVFLLVLLVIDFGVIVWSIQKTTEDKSTKKEMAESVNQGISPIETAIAALILNYIKEREDEKRKPVENP